MGSREPRLKVIPRFTYSDGSDAVTLAESYGFFPDPWQSDVLHIWFARDRYGSYAASRVGLLVPRQNGKNGIIEVMEFFSLVILGERILHSAHRVATAKVAFERLEAFFTNSAYPELQALVKSIRYTNGQESIALTNGGRIDFVSRSGATKRGDSFDKLVVDEAQYLTDGQLNALMFTVAAAKELPQVVYVGTPPDPSEGAFGVVFGRVRSNAIEKKAKRHAWHEWSVEEIGDVYDKARWAQANPALGIRLRVDTVEQEILDASVDGFARERLGWWSQHSASAVVSKDLWNKLVVKSAPPKDEGKLCYGVKFSPDGSTVALAVAQKVNDVVHVEGIKHMSMASGTTWLVGWLSERHSKAAQIIIDGKGADDTLIERLKAAGVREQVLQKPRAGDVTTSSSMLLNSVREKTLTHIGQQALDHSVLNATSRDIGKGGGWGFAPISDDVDVTLVEAVALAHWSVKTTRRNPNRQQEVSFG